MTLTKVVGKHYAKFLGKPSDGYTVTSDRHPKGHYHILRFEDVPFQGAIALLTIGISDIPLHMFRQELLLLCYTRFMSKDLVAWVAGVEESVTSSNHPLLQGQVLRMRKPLSLSTTMEAMYSTVPTYFPDGFQMIDTNDTKIDIGWLIPIYTSEAEWIEEHGWDAFEKLLVEFDPDVMDLTRETIV